MSDTETGPHKEGPSKVSAAPQRTETEPKGTPLALAERLLAAGIPVVVCKPCPGYGKPGECAWRGHDDGTVELHQPKGWPRLTADECDLSGFRPGVDTLAMVSGHGIDLVDVDTKADGSVSHLPPFQHYGVTRTPSGGEHYVVPSTGFGKVSPFDTLVGHVGDYVGGRPDGTGRLLGYLPGSTRPKYLGKSYVEEVTWDIAGCLAAQPDPALVTALGMAGASDTVHEEYVDESPLRPVEAGVHPEAEKGVRRALDRLDRLPAAWSDGDHWDEEHHRVASILRRYANSNWTGYTLEAAEADYLAHARTDESWGDGKVEEKWDYAGDTVQGGGIEPPYQEFLDEPLPPVQRPAERWPLLDIVRLLDPDRPERTWLWEGIVPQGDQASLVAPAGVGKSLLVLALVWACLRDEGEFIGRGITFTGKVLYVDKENSEDDWADRLRDLGVTQDEARRLLGTRFFPLSLPRMSGLDTKAGADQLIEVLDLYGLEPGDLVVLDSTQRITEGEENSNDAMRALWSNTGEELKRRHLTVIRTDNTGKDVERGARGASGKVDDVGYSWLLKPQAGDTFTLSQTKRRSRGGEDGDLTFRRESDDRGLLTFTQAAPRKGARAEPEVMEKVAAFLATLPAKHKGASKTFIRSEVSAGNEKVDAALAELVRFDYVSETADGQAKLHRLVKPYTPDFEA
jgi:hypothetical protein